MATQTVSTATALDLLRMMDGFVILQALFAAAKLGISDLLKNGERSSDELAATLRIDRDVLYRTMRFRAGQGVFYETTAQNYRRQPTVGVAALGPLRARYVLS